jgi:hypothetical protein
VRVDTVDLMVRATYQGPDVVELTPLRAAIDLIQAVQQVKAALPGSAVSAKVTCGPVGAKVLLADVGTTFTCTVSLNGNSGSLTYRVLDVDGHVQKVT